MNTNTSAVFRMTTLTASAALATVMVAGTVGSALAQPGSVAPVAPTAPAAPAAPAKPAVPAVPAKPGAAAVDSHGHATAEGQGIAGGAVSGPTHPATSPLKFETTNHDFGKIPDSAPVSFEFKFKNVSDKVVNIVNATGSCGCTVPTFEKQHQPGGEGKITATFNPAGRNGREVKTVTVYLDDPATPTLQLQIVADVQKRVIVEPMQVYMGEVNYKTARDQTVTVTGRAENFDVTNVEVQGSGYKIVQTGKDKVDVSGEQLNRVSYKVSIDDTLPISRVQANAVFTTNDPATPTVNVSLIADVVGQVRLSPPQMGVKMSAPNEPFTSDVYLENREAQPFEILGVSFEPAAGTPPGTDLMAVLDVTRREPTSKAAYRIRLAGTTPANATELRGTIKIQTDVKDQAEISVPVSGFQVAAAYPAPGSKIQAGMTVPPKANAVAPKTTAPAAPVAPAAPANETTSSNGATPNAPANPGTPMVKK